MTFNWSPEAVERLTTLAGEGLSARQIGLELNVSRSAVIGKARRDGIALPKGRGGQPGNAGNKLRGRPRKRAFRFENGPRLAPTFVDPAPLPIEPLRVPFMEVREGQCREVVGTGEDGLALFCGHAKSGPTSFCVAHRRANYVMVAD